MSGPMQWTQGQFVPAIGVVPNPGQQRGGVVPEVTSDGPVFVELPEPAPVHRPAAKNKPAPKNIVALAKARLREVKKELKVKKALEKERDELERLIAAADSKPRAVVTNLKRTAG